MINEQKTVLKHTINKKCQPVKCIEKSVSDRCILFYSLYQASTDLDFNIFRDCQDFNGIYTTSSNVSTSTPVADIIDSKKPNQLTATPAYQVYDENRENDEAKTLFGCNETIVYMTLFDDYYRQRSSGTQATASVNKCFQVYSKGGDQHFRKPLVLNSNDFSTSTVSTSPYYDTVQHSQGMRFSEVYFFGRSKDNSKQKGMGPKGSKNSFRKSEQSSSCATRSDVRSKSSCGSNTVAKRNKGASTGTSTYKSVSIKDDKPDKPCPAKGTSKGEMMVTISHIKIGPKETCPIIGKEPCIGPKCIVAASGQEQAPVKVTTVNNPRRGVFELVIRRMTGAPLAKNELMLEWTPPPSRPPCPSPCSTSWPPMPCRPSKCKLISCRPSPCKPKCCRKKPCGQPCKKPSCCGIPCKSKLCPPLRCCIPSPCKSPCSQITCKTPCFTCCKSSPCLRPCPVGRKKPRKSRSQPKIRSHRQRISPCCNRSKTCPVVRCRSVPGPCIGCCGLPPFCPPAKCCSLSPCNPPKCCKSSCSTCI